MPPSATAPAQQLSQAPPGAGTTSIGRALRAFDLIAVILLLPLVLPVALVISLVVFLDSPGAVLYRARRIGLGGREFSMLKFRTMRYGAGGPALTREYDDRFTPVGRFLARARLDELPQVWHVITGKMRLVGPRPEDPGFVHLYERQYEEILTMPPGITGCAQLVHFADDIELDVEDPATHYAERILPAKLALDAEYVRNRSLWLDLRIVGRTLLLPLRLGAHALAAAVARHQGQTATTLLVVAVLLIAFTAAGGPAR